VEQWVSDQTSDNLNSPFAEQRRQGFNWLRFDDFVEEEFRQYFAQNNLKRARIMPILTIAATLIAIGLMLASPRSNLVMLVYNIFGVLPIMALTLYASTKPRWHQFYQVMLALSTLIVGLWVTSIVSRASIQGMPFYFAAEIAWLFVVWLIVGLPFRHAAIVALTISFMYMLGNFYWDFSISELAFGATMLAFVNGFGALACYQLEFAVRTSFLESKELNQLAERDGLTGLYNRRSYDKYIQRIWRQSRREQAQLTVMLIDIDHFKSFNDHYGHQAGDDALKTVANVIRMSAQRPLDFAARFGGEEFALILYGPADEYGRGLPEQLREAIRNCEIYHEASPTDEFLTVSIGVAMVMPDAERSMAGAIQMADEALYQAKEEGRNTVVLRKSDDFKFQTGRFRARKKATA
jgi:diguanylate cyclase (GGDEF)-like protein